MFGRSGGFHSPLIDRKTGFVVWFPDKPPRIPGSRFGGTGALAPTLTKEKTGMAHFLWLLAGTIWLRPYVFIFLGAYLLIAIWHLGAGRALAFLVLGYLISWAA